MNGCLLIEPPLMCPVNVAARSHSRSWEDDEEGNAADIRDGVEAVRHWHGSGPTGRRVEKDEGGGNEGDDCYDVFHDFLVNCVDAACAALYTFYLPGAVTYIS